MAETMNEAPVISTLDFNLSDRCNLCCSFCYTRNGNGNGPDMKRTKRILTWYYDQLKSGFSRQPQRRHATNINIYGGEPLMEWDDLKETVTWARNTYPDIQFNAGIVTNMTLLTEDKLDWLIENRIGVHPSIDGCQEAEDTHRIFKDGTGASSLVYKNARYLLSRVPGRSCRMTVSPETVPYVFKSIVFLCENLGFRTVNAILAGGVEWTPVQLDAFKEQISRLTDWWIAKMRNGEHYSLYHLRNMFGAIWNGRRRRSLCSSGISRVGVDTNEDMWPCHRFCNQASFPEYKLGTIATGFTNMELHSTLKGYDIAEAMKDKCSTCPAVLGCHALCLHEMMLAQRGMFTPNQHYCYIWPFYWSEAMRAHSLMTAEKNRLYDHTYREIGKARPQRVRRSNSRRENQDPAVDKRIEVLEQEMRKLSLNQCHCAK